MYKFKLVAMGIAGLLVAVAASTPFQPVTAAEGVQQEPTRPASEAQRPGEKPAANAAREEHRKHLETLAKCAGACEMASHRTLQRLRQEGESENREEYAKAHEYTMDCAAFCQLAAKLSAHHSPLTRFAHQACADACRACADVCAAVPNDQTLQQCAEYCKTCAEACDQMAKEKAHGSHEQHHPAKDQKQQEERNP